MAKHVGILTAGGDSPGLNAAIRGVGKAAQVVYGMDVIGFRDGFRGLMQDRIMRLDGPTLSDILTRGGTILGASRDKPHRMPVGNKLLDMTDVIVSTYKRHHLDVLVCLGGGGTQKNALRLTKKGLNVITLPKTIDNDVAMTDTTFGFDTALGISTAAIDRLHSTAHSHHRIIVVEIMGHRTGWLALGAGIAGGADVILIPEIPYDIKTVAKAIRQRSREGKQFSIVALSEGAMSNDDMKAVSAVDEQKKGGTRKEKAASDAELAKLEMRLANRTLSLSKRLEQLTGLESRVTILGHLQRGGTPSAADRLLATRLGTACARLINEGVAGVMVAARGDEAVPVPLEEVAGLRKTVAVDHPWIQAARDVGTCLGD
ncbi:MAG TPA: ATP-dependent 6-phosphofructokinase [Acidobacteriota bacterium]|nr:ATP-dependent 6-phosphofructokinase [Acidobacteriota bacterium]